jgi:predicted nucleic acid-binding protein
LANWLLDTNVISHLMRHESVVEHRLIQAALTDSIALSVVSHSETVYGLRRMPAGRRRRSLEREYERLLPLLGRMLEVTRPIAETQARIKADLEGRGILLPQNDLWIAATALGAGLTLVTNDSHFAAVPDLRTVNWLSEP